MAFRAAVLDALPSLLLATALAGLGTASRAQAASPAPAPQTLQAFVDQVLQHNPALMAQRAQVQAAEQVPSQAAALPDPTADLEFMDLSLNRPSLSDALTKSVSVGVTQTLPYPGKRRLAKERAEKEAAVAAAKLRAMESDLRGRAVGAAYGLSLAQKLLDLNEQTQSALAAAAKSAQGVYASGRGTQADVLLAQTALTRALSDHEELARQKAVILEELRRLAGGPVDGEGLAALPLPEPASLPAFETLAASLPSSAPTVSTAQAQTEVAEAGVAVARRGFKPDFMVGGRYRRDDMSMGGGDYLTATFGVTLPFFHRKDRYEPALQEALDRREGARLGAQDALVESRYDLSEAYQEALRDLRVYRLDQGGLLLQARQAYESSLAGYSVGTVDFSTLLTALTNLYAYQGETLSAQANYQRALARMEAVLGRALPATPPEGAPAPTEKEDPK